MVGEYSLRGGILDVFSPEAAKPVRIDLFGDQVESIRRFDVESQRSVLKIEECVLLPLTEFQRSRQLWLRLGELVEQESRGHPPGEAFPGWELLAPLLNPRETCVFGLVERPLILWDEPEQVRGAAERFWKRLEQLGTGGSGIGAGNPSGIDIGRIYFSFDELLH